MIISSDEGLGFRAKTESQFWSKINEKKLQLSFNPFAKERRDLIFRGNGVIFRGEFDGGAQNFYFFPKRGNRVQDFDSNIIIVENFEPKKFF